LGLQQSELAQFSSRRDSGKWPVVERSDTTGRQATRHAPTLKGNAVKHYVVVFSRVITFFGPTAHSFT